MRILFAQIQNSKSQMTKIKYPILVLTVSGGHTMLVLMNGHGKYKTIGETLDDAAGEAFDKAAKLLGIGYPGGPAISAYAEKFKAPNYKLQITRPPDCVSRSGAANKFKIQNSKFKISLPRPMINSGDFNFSFSGLKTALLYAVQKDLHWKKRVPEYCHEFQQAVVDVLIYKTIKATEKYRVKNIMLAGGVSANKELRKQMAEAIKNKIPDSKFQIPDSKFCTDNAAMIATAGYYKAVRKKFTPWDKVRVDCNLELK